jgi:hypothetical protein
MSEKTIPVNVIIPEAIEEYIAIAAAELIPAVRAGRKEASILGRVKPIETAPAAYQTGMIQVGSRDRRISRNLFK